MREYRKIVRSRQARIDRRLHRRQWCQQAGPMMSGSNIHYQMSARTEAIGCGGVGAFHLLAQRIGLVDEINSRLPLLKRHLPYFESDHVRNIAYNILVGGQRLEDIELRRQDVTFMNALGARILPDPTTAGDFTRRFTPASIEILMDCINVVRQRVWQQSSTAPFEEALIDVDGTLAPTTGECKQGMEYSYKKVWGYHPLIVSLANTGEVLFLKNRPGNAVSHAGAAEQIDRAIDLVAPYADRICVRGDTDFYLTQHFDRWSDRVHFLFGMDAFENVRERAQTFSEGSWRPFFRKPRYQALTRERQKPENVKETIIRQRGFTNIRLVMEHVTEIPYRPTKCKKTYRLVIVRKNLSIEKGETVLFPEHRYFFYITTRTDLSAEQVVERANGRCNQENVIEQLKNGVNAMRMPVDNLVSNWAYMVMAALAWNLKAWFAMLMPQPERSMQLLKMEYRQFLNAIIRIPCQIVRTGRQIVYRVLGYNTWLMDFLETWEQIKRLKPA